MDDDWGYPHFSKPPHGLSLNIFQQVSQAECRDDTWDAMMCLGRTGTHPDKFGRIVLVHRAEQRAHFAVSVGITALVSPGRLDELN